MTRSEVSTIQLLSLFSFLALSVFAICGCNESMESVVAARTDREGKLLSEARAIISDGLSDSDPQIRTHSIEIVSDTRQVEFMPKVKKLLLDDYVPVRFAAALAVGDTEYAMAKDSVEKLLQVPEENTRIAAAYAMYKLGSAGSINIILEGLKSRDQTVRANAAVLLGKSGDTSHLKALYWALRNDESEDKVRFQAAEAIAMLGDEQIFRKLWAILISVYADDRVFALKAMGSLGTKQAKDVLTTKLDDDVLEVRLAAAEQLGALGDPIGEPEVLEVFSRKLTAGMDEEDRQRAYARTALAIGQIGTKSLRRYLPKLLKDKSKLVRLSAAKAVFQLVKSN